MIKLKNIAAAVPYAFLLDEPHIQLEDVDGSSVKHIEGGIPIAEIIHFNNEARCLSLPTTVMSCSEFSV
jgi:hypothetical protein